MGALEQQKPTRNAGRFAWSGLNGWIGRVESILSDLGAICVILICAYVVLGIFMRSVVGSQIPDEVVIVGELMVGVLILPLAFVAAENGFIAVEIFTGRFGPRGSAWLSALAAMVGLFAITPITIAGLFSFTEAVHEGNYSYGQLSLPEWPGKLTFFLGYLLFSIRLVFLLLQEALAGLGMRQISPEINDATDKGDT